MVRELYDRLRRSGNYQKIKLHDEYNIHGRTGGELDIHAIHNRGYHVYYEIKTTPDGEHKALKQFRRWQTQFPKIPTKYVLVVANPGYVERKYVN